MSVHVSAPGPLISRLSVESLAAAGSDWFELSLKDRTQPGIYVGRQIAIAGGDTRDILSATGSRYFVSPWSNQPSAGSVYEIRSTPVGIGENWYMYVAQRYNPLGNGSFGSLIFAFDRSPNQDGSQLEVMGGLDPKGTPGQNGNDAEFWVNTQVFKVVSDNTLRGNPRPQDGNLQVPAGSHIGTDATALDVGPEWVAGRAVIPPPWSRLLNIHCDGLDSNGQWVTYSQGLVTRVMDPTAGQTKADLLYRVAGLAGHFKMSWNGQFGIEDDSGNTIPLNQRGTWTPVLVGTSGTAVHSYQSGTWQRTWDTVTYWGRIQIANRGNMSGPARIAGFLHPASFNATGGGSFDQIDGFALPGGFTQMTLRMDGDFASLCMARFDGGNADFLPSTALMPNANIRFTAVFRTG